MAGLRKGANAKKNKEKPKEKEKKTTMRMGVVQLEQKVETDEYKIDTRANWMGSCHYLTFVLVILACTVLLLVGSAYHTPMLKYNESDIYSCPKPVYAAAYKTGEIDEEHKELNNQGKRKFVDKFTGQKDEDFFYDPLACQPFYANSSEPVWYGRVEHLVPEN